MLRARADLLGSGAFAPISDALITAVRASLRPLTIRDGQHAAGAAPRPLRVADLGCGTGHYSAELARAMPELELLLADRSPDAVRAGLRTLRSATGIVLDIWRPLPLRTDAADVILNVFAPRNLEEFARVLRPGGELLVVVPTERHLQELRREGLVLDIPSGKSAKLVEQFTGAGFTLRSNTQIEYPLEASGLTRLLLAEMGPSAHHTDALARDDATESPAAPDATEPITVSVELLSFELTAPA
ncbi:methyltransferase domain-containing protein [Agromyces sp. NPDC058064]|uniref:methyltransferase domain-containing protein n=1 Tax=Agromyces sp. NPDC058064 TaxID=3346322 RepID=UPI0036DEBD68